MSVATDGLGDGTDGDGFDLTSEAAKLQEQIASLHQISEPLAAQAHLAAIIECSDDAIISKSLDGIILSWNAAAERIFGYTADEAVGQSIQMLIPADRHSEEMEIIARLQGGARIDHFKTVRLTRDGRRLDVVVSISPIKDKAGKIVGASKTLRDVSAQREADQALRDGQARLRAVVDSAVDGILTINEMGTIESINPAAIGAFGYEAEELIGENIKVLMPEPYFSEHDAYLDNFRRTGERKIIGIGREVVGKRKDGSTFPVELAVSEVQLGEGRIFTGIVRDITVRKDFELALVQEIEKAEAASRAKEHFLSVLSHELRTPLTPVLAEVSFMERRPDLPEDVRSHLAMIRRNVETEARLVDDLLDLTRITRDKIRLHYEVVDLHETILAALRMFESPIQSKGLETCHAMRARRHHVWADPGRLQQILLNLLSNAVKFSNERGTISISTSNPDESGIRMELSDNGVGIEPEMMGRIFDPFEQSNDSRRSGGLGLGLSIARSLTELHDGSLTAHSDGRGRGAAFVLTLRTVQRVDRENAPELPPEAMKLGRRILLVEDHEDTRRVMARLLKGLGCQVTTAGSVREAIEAAGAGKFDLLISDIGLPDGSGLDVMQHFKKLAVRGIALSGYGQEEDLARSREAGFEKHLIKPLNFNMLRDVLEQVN